MPLLYAFPIVWRHWCVANNIEKQTLALKCQQLLL